MNHEFQKREALFQYFPGAITYQPFLAEAIPDFCQLQLCSYGSYRRDWLAQMQPMPAPDAGSIPTELRKFVCFVASLACFKNQPCQLQRVKMVQKRTLRGFLKSPPTWLKSL